MPPEGKRKKTWPKRVALALLILAATGLLLCVVTIEVLLHPAPKQVPDAPPALAWESVRIEAPGAETVHGWYARAPRDSDAVLLLHGLRAHRGQMQARLTWLQELGYAGLAIDLPSHGESKGERMSFGHDEARAVRDSLLWLRAKGHKRVAAIGHSLGAASCLLGPKGPAPFDALVLEACYPDIETGLSRRLERRLGAVGRWLTPLMCKIGELRLGLARAQLAPIVRAAEVEAPVFVLSGSADTRTKPEDTQRFFDAVRAPKRLWLLPGAAHIDLHAHAGEEYERRVGAFLREHGLRPAKR